MKIKLLSPKAKIPTQGTVGAAGWDLYAAIETPVIIKSGENLPVPIDIAMEIPEGYVGLIYPRSGLACKQGLRLSNGVAVIDPDFRGCVVVSLYNDSDRTRVITPGERIAQFILQKVEDPKFEIVNILSETKRDTGGFGSTGNK